MSSVKIRFIAIAVVILLALVLGELKSREKSTPQVVYTTPVQVVK